MESPDIPIRDHSPVDTNQFAMVLFRLKGRLRGENLAAPREESMTSRGRPRTRSLFHDPARPCHSSARV